MSDLDKEELEATRNIGKTADGLSEEEIIKTVENFLDGYRQYNVETGETYVPYKYGEGQKFCYVEDFEAIQGLLDLYKEKNKQIQVEIEGRNILVGLNENLKEELKKEKEMNAVQRKMLNDAFDRGWIHKDKVRERIRELKIIRDENADEIKRNMRFYSIYDSYNLQINELHDLLLEEWLDE